MREQANTVWRHELWIIAQQLCSDVNSAHTTSAKCIGCDAIYGALVKVRSES